MKHVRSKIQIGVLLLGMLCMLVPNIVAKAGDSSVYTEGDVVSLMDLKIGDVLENGAILDNKVRLENGQQVYAKGVYLNWCPTKEAAKEHYDGDYEHPSFNNRKITFTGKKDIDRWTVGGLGSVNSNGSSIENCDVYLYPSVHVKHKWQFSMSGDKAICSCKEPGHYGGNVTYELFADNAEYTCGEYEAAAGKVTGEFDGPEYTLVYYLEDGKTKTSTKNSGAGKAGSAPVKVGNYVVKMVTKNDDEVILSKAFSIERHLMADEDYYIKAVGTEYYLSVKKDHMQLTTEESEFVLSEANGGYEIHFDDGTKAIGVMQDDSRNLGFQGDEALFHFLRQEDGSYFITVAQTDKFFGADEALKDGVTVYYDKAKAQGIKWEFVPGHNWDEGKITTEPTCTEPGIKTYTCIDCRKTKTEEIPAKGHDYRSPKFAWTGYAACKATFTCANDSRHTKKVACKITSKVTKEPTVEAEGEKVYTATATLNDKEYTDQKKKILPKLDKDDDNHDGDSDYDGAPDGSNENPVITNRLNSKFKVYEEGRKIYVFWNTTEKADGYEVYATYCGKGKKFQKVKHLKGAKANCAVITKLNGTRIDTKKQAKVLVAAYKKINGKKQYIGRTVIGHIVGSKSKKYTDAKYLKLKENSFALKKGETAKIKATTVKANKKLKILNHVAEFRYVSSNQKVAKVSVTGKIKAKRKGKCTIYVYAVNGCSKKVTVTVK